MSTIIKVAILSIIIGCISIPVGFDISSSLLLVWLGYSLGSILFAVAVVYVGEHITSAHFRTKMSRYRYGRKIVDTFENGNDHKYVIKSRDFINKHGIRVFAFFCPIFPGVLVATSAVYLFKLNKKVYKRWMFCGVIFACSAYVVAYWWLFIRQTG